MRVHILRLEREHALRGFNRRPEIAVEGLELAEVVQTGDESGQPPQELLGDPSPFRAPAAHRPRPARAGSDRAPAAWSGGPAAASVSPSGLLRGRSLAVHRQVYPPTMMDTLVCIRQVTRLRSSWRRTTSAPIRKI